MTISTEELTTTTRTTRRPSPPEIQQRFCSECGGATRIHKWGPIRADGSVPQYEHWYRDGKGGFKCFSCYMSKFWADRKRLVEKEKEQRGELQRLLKEKKGRKKKEKKGRKKGRKNK